MNHNLVGNKIKDLFTIAASPFNKKKLGHLSIQKEYNARLKVRFPNNQIVKLDNDINWYALSITDVEGERERIRWMYAFCAR